MHETVYLSDPRNPLRIEYSREAMEHIRKRARDGLMAAPRVGMGVGGLLLGVREKGLVRLLDSVEIPCCHSAGPSFSLTAEERQLARETIAEAGLFEMPGKVGVIGLYCSKTRGETVLTEHDLNLFYELFPKSDQIAMVVRPSAAEPMHAAFFYRNEKGAVAKGVECDVEEWRPDPKNPEADLKPAAPVAERPEPIVSTKVVEISSPAVKQTASTAKPARLPETKLADIVDLSSSPAGPAPSHPDNLLFPGFMAIQPPRPRSKVRMALLLAAALAVVAAALFFIRDYWIPKPTLSLTSTELNGTLLIRWNPEALRGVNEASMYVNDGGQTTPELIPLDRFQLSSGLLSYTPKSQRVTAKLDAGGTSAITAWFAPVTQAPVTSAPVTPAPVTPSAPDTAHP